MLYWIKENAKSWEKIYPLHAWIWAFIDQSFSQNWYNSCYVGDYHYFLVELIEADN